MYNSFLPSNRNYMSEMVLYQHGLNDSTWRVIGCIGNQYNDSEPPKGVSHCQFNHQTTHQLRFNHNQRVLWFCTHHLFCFVFFTPLFLFFMFLSTASLLSKPILLFSTTWQHKDEDCCWLMGYSVAAEDCFVILPLPPFSPSGSPSTKIAQMTSC